MSAFFFHIDHESPYTEKVLLRPGECVSTFDRAVNPFFKNCQDVVSSISVDERRIRLLEFMSMAKNFCEKDLRRVVGDTRTIVAGYIKLVRELEFENIRREHFLYRPSRTRCIWLAENLEAARSWMSRLEGRTNARILRVRVDNDPFLTNESYLMQDSHSIKETQALARLYWSGTPTSAGRSELLFEGEFEVVEVLDA